jgi:hypothetical protein
MERRLQQRSCETGVLPVLIFSCLERRLGEKAAQQSPNHTMHILPYYDIMFISSNSTFINLIE